jgi:hypothetical protein
MRTAAKKSVREGGSFFRLAEQRRDRLGRRERDAVGEDDVAADAERGLARSGGQRGTRTPDILLVRQAL